MRKVLAQIAIAAGMTGSLAPAQSLSDQVNFRNGELGGIHLYGVTVFSGYTTSPYPFGIGQIAPVGLQDIGGTANYGFSASLGWRHHRRRTDVSIMYSGTYDGMVRYSDLNAFNHSLSLSVGRTLSPRWTLSLVGFGSDYTMTQFLHQPGTSSVISQLPVTFDDFAAAFSAGQFSNAQVASMLTGAPVLPAAVRAQLLGNRVLSYAVQAGLNYAYSPRLKFHFSSANASGQSWRGGRNGIPRESLAQPNTLGINAGVSMGLSYALSPRTEVGLNAEETYMLSRYLGGAQAGFTTSVSASLGRKMGRRWFLNIYTGGSLTHLTQQSYGMPRTQQIIGGGSLGVKMGAHTLVGSYARGNAATYGFAPGTTTTLTGTWGWRPAGGRWGLFASGGQEQMRRTGYISISGWEGSGGVSFRLNSHVSATAQYAYLDSTGRYLGINNPFSMHSVRVSLGWSPLPERR